MPTKIPVQTNIFDNSGEKIYKVPQSALPITKETSERHNSQEYRRVKPYGRESVETTLQRLKEIAEYSSKPRSTPVAVFNPSTVLHKGEGMKHGRTL